MGRFRGPLTIGEIRQHFTLRPLHQGVIAQGLPNAANELLRRERTPCRPLYSWLAAFSFASTSASRRPLIASSIFVRVGRDILMCNTSAR